MLEKKREKKGGMEGGRNGRREGWREGGKEGPRNCEREGGKNEGRDGVKKAGSEGVQVTEINLLSLSTMTTMVCGIAPLRAPIPFTNSKSTLKPSSFSWTLSSMISISMHLVEPTTPAGKVTLRVVPWLKSIPSEGDVAGVGKHRGRRGGGGGGGGEGEEEGEEGGGGRGGGRRRKGRREEEEREEEEGEEGGGGKGGGGKGQDKARLQVVASKPATLSLHRILL